MQDSKFVTVKIPRAQADALREIVESAEAQEKGMIDLSSAVREAVKKEIENWEHYRKVARGDYNIVG